MTEALLAPTFLFRFSVRCRRRDLLWPARGGELSEDHRLPAFGALDGRAAFAEVRAAWSHDGLLFTVLVAGKKQSPWCRGTRVEDSDGLHVWIDTRDTHTIHRATRFCHRFAFLPLGGGPAADEPLARLLPINRARENPKPFADRGLRVRSQSRRDGYVLFAHVPVAALTGFDPAEHPRLGFTYAVTDHERGVQTFSVGAEFPVEEDPSLWGSLELVQD